MSKVLIVLSPGSTARNWISQCGSAWLPRFTRHLRTTRVRMSSNNSTGSTCQRSAEALGNLEREHGLAGPGLAFDQQRTLERDGGIDRDLEVVGRDIGTRVPSKRMGSGI